PYKCLFVGSEQEERYRKLEQRKVWTERIMQIRHDGDFRSCWKIFHDRKWDKLCEPETKLNLEIVHEFFVNALTSDGGWFEFNTMV
ncbi:hypothetical protein RYX36_000887, partial [Vicia faba]